VNCKNYLRPRTFVVREQNVGSREESWKEKREKRQAGVPKNLAEALRRIVPGAARFASTRNDSRHSSGTEDVHALGVQTAIMVGGGNIFRGARQKGFEIDRATGDYMGMLATVINALALQTHSKKKRVHSRAERHRNERGFRAVYPAARDTAPGKGPRGDFRGGTWESLFFNGHGGALRAMEIKADVILKATRVDGVYDADSRADSGREIFCRDFLRRGAEPEPEGDGLDGDFAVHGQRHADRGVQHEAGGEHQAGVLGERVGSKVTPA